MYYLAFDVSKAKLNGVLTNLRTVSRSFELPNTREAIAAWFAKEKLPKKVFLGCESTGSYHYSLLQHATQAGYTFKLLNPLTTKQFTRVTIRKKKTDESDTLIIAKLLAQGEGTVVLWKQEDASVKAQARALEKLGRMRQALVRLKDSLRVYESDVLIRSLEGEIDRVAETIEGAVHEQTKKLEQTYKHTKKIELLESMPGIGFKLAFRIAAECGDVSRFSSPKQLVAFAGLDPRIRQSGSTLHSQGKLTKRGSPSLRTALFLATNVARMHDSELKVYYEKKRSEGKKFTVAVVATARKLVNRIYAVLSRETPYEKRLVPATP